MSLDQTADFVKHQTLTSDAFLGGRITVSQPQKGFRAGLDSVLLGAAVGPGRKRLLDLGAGVGTAALVALAHGAERQALLVEANPELVLVAQGNLAANGFAERGSIVLLDVTAKGALRQAAGMGPDSFDTVIANPPFFDATGGTLPPSPGRAAARHMAPEGIEAWVRSAAAALKPGGEAIFIHRAAALPDLLAAFEGRFGALTILPIAARQADAAQRVLLRGIKGSRAPLRLSAPLVLHEAGQAFRPALKAIFMGEAVLDW